MANYTKPWEWKFHGPPVRRISKSSLLGGHHSGLRSGFASTPALVMPTTPGEFSDPTGLRPVEFPQSRPGGICCCYYNTNGNGNPICLRPVGSGNSSLVGASVGPTFRPSASTPALLLPPLGRNFPIPRPSADGIPTILPLLVQFS